MYKPLIRKKERKRLETNLNFAILYFLDSTSKSNNNQLTSKYYSYI